MAAPRGDYDPGMEHSPIQIHTPQIRLDALLKFAGAVGTGGEAKFLIQSGRVRVNGALENRRSHRIGPGDRVELLDEDGQAALSLEIVGPAD